MGCTTMELNPKASKYILTNGKLFPRFNHVFVRIRLAIQSKFSLYIQVLICSPQQRTASRTANHRIRQFLMESIQAMME